MKGKSGSMHKIHLLIGLLLLIIYALGCKTGTRELTDISHSKIGPITKPVNTDLYKNMFYVSINSGSDQSGDGTDTNPWQNLNYALSQLDKSAINNRSAILVAEGYYPDCPIKMSEYIDLYGGFNSANWQRDIETYKSVLSGEEKNRVLLGANNAQIDGFIITKGLIRDKGAGIVCNSVSPKITNNVFVDNMTLSPKPWNPKFIHETAHDGGAIYCCNGASPFIEHNLFIYNKTENGRGAGIALDNRCNARITNNIFIENISGLKDPMRSSDGGAISVFDWSNPVIENNIVMGNKALNKNDGGGIFVALWSSAIINKNIIIGNDSGDDAGGLFVGGQEHRYDVPFDPIPPKEKFFVEVSDNIIMGNIHAGQNSGAMRITMDSRGIVRNNIIVHNTGVYFQKSELTVIDNIIMENVIVRDKKEYFEPIILKNNIIWGDFILETDATVINNNIKNGFNGKGNYSVKPIFTENEIQFKLKKVIYHDEKYFSTLEIEAGDYQIDELVNRIVRAGNKWGTVKSNNKSELMIWGDFSGEKMFTLIPVIVSQSAGSSR